MGNGGEVEEYICDLLKARKSDFSGVEYRHLTILC